MMRSGKSQKNNYANSEPVASLEPSVVIIAEIAFAAVLLYLTNQPLELSDLTQAQTQVQTPAQESPVNLAIQENLDPLELDSPTAVAVAVSTISIESLGITLEPLASN